MLNPQEVPYLEID